MRSTTTVGIAVVCAALMLGAASPLAAQDQPCSACGPGDHWVDDCAAGDDSLSQTGAEIGLDLDGDCQADTSMVLWGPTTIHREAGVVTPPPHSIQTEIVSLNLTDGTYTLIAGQGMGQGGVLSASLGSIAETSDPAVADSFFDVYFEMDIGGGSYVYNHAALRIDAEIRCVPPNATYIHPTGCLPLYSNPEGTGEPVAWLVSARHKTFPGIPTVSEWGLIVLTVLLLTAGGIVIARRRRRVAAA